MLDLLKRIKDANTTFKGDLAFVNDWEYFSSGKMPTLRSVQDLL